MLDPNLFRDDLEAVTRRLSDRGVTASLGGFTHLDTERRRLLAESEPMRHRKKVASQEIGGLLKEGKKDDAEARKGEVKELTGKIKAAEEALEGIEEQIETFLLDLPNLAHDSVPVGADESANTVARTVGERPAFDFEPKDHVDVGEALGILDFERSAKIAGARFAVLTGAGARLERALINFMLDLHTGEHGYTEVLPPFLVNSAALTGTGQLPKFAEDLFKVEGVDLRLVPTAEVPLANLRAGEILDRSDLPVRLTAYTPCFRSEAGSYGKDVRGLIRLHQFNKVELVSLCEPESSYDELERLTANAEEVLKRLELPYRVVTLSTGDMGFAASKTYDLEVWLPAQKTYREISSCSNCESFQARRMKTRFRREKKAKPEWVHTLNGSGLAVGRTLVAILENCQQADGSVVVPSALRPYTGGLDVIRPPA